MLFKIFKYKFVKVKFYLYICIMSFILGVIVGALGMYYYIKNKMQTP